MRARPFSALLVLAVLLAALPASAQDGWKTFTFTPMGGWTFFDEQYPIEDGMYAGGRLGWHFHRFLGIELAGGWSPSKEDFSGGEDLNWVHGSGNLILTPAPEWRISPFGVLGGGFERFGGPGSDGESHPAFDAGAGVLLKVNDAVGLRLEARNVLWIPRKDPQSAHLNQMMLAGGITFGWGGKPKDTDGDGVPDRNDKCPDTKTGCTVDASGCPADADGDGVCDGLDACAATPKGATVDAKGCPADADGDGAFDGLDQCADTPKGATVDAKGCPTDADGDGVFDGLDQCASTPAGARVDAKGCPTDADGDGVFDGLDRCENTPAGAKVDKDGCPIEITEKETELLDTGMIRLQNINFETAKADLLPESYPTLDIVGQLLARWPELKIEIGGHTDSRGGDAYNQKLSESRAQAVLDYLLQHVSSLKADQYTIKGYGESKPVAPNTNALNMAKNRRVEFVVLNKDVLKKESERRRLLQKGEGENK